MVLENLVAESATFTTNELSATPQLKKLQPLQIKMKHRYPLKFPSEAIATNKSKKSIKIMLFETF